MIDTNLGSFVWFVALIWFLVYWILGGVFFSLMAVLKMGTVRKVRFSCLFTILSFVSAVGAAWGGFKLANEGVQGCLQDASTKAEIITAIFGCGFVGIFSAFALGLIVLISVGAVCLKLSTTKSKPWIDLGGEKGDKGV